MMALSRRDLLRAAIVCVPALDLPSRRAWPLPVAHDVRRFGALGDGRHDDTAAIQAAVDRLPPRGGTVTLPAGVYLIDALVSLVLRDGVTLHLADGAELRARPNAATHSAVVKAWGCRDVAVRGGRIVGERAEHRGSGGEWGMGIDFRAVDGALIEDLSVESCWGDGLYVGYLTDAQVTGGESRDVHIRRTMSRGNRRQGLSVTGCFGALIEHSSFVDTDGTAPRAGIDLEPDGVKRVDRVRVEHCDLSRNAGSGIMAVGEGTTRAVIRNNRCAGNRGHGVQLHGARECLVTGNTTEANRRHGICLTDAASDNGMEGNRFGPAAWMATLRSMADIYIGPGCRRNRIGSNRREDGRAVRVTDLGAETARS